ncbi:hypothetical protein KC19_VG288900 [Ceratodon purpureus]|uniref:Uncharacterized protein n=1 Tax=Ceratodon purpureus TaxID=3225 RepID=A0A8T0HWB3_CERPU|nr:hypothetical protein KC19_VG288900 [Ceratodon purpureus]
MCINAQFNHTLTTQSQESQVVTSTRIKTELTHKRYGSCCTNRLNSLAPANSTQPWSIISLGLSCSPTVLTVVAACSRCMPMLLITSQAIAQTSSSSDSRSSTMQ